MPLESTSDTPQFFTSQTTDTCQHANGFLEASNNTVRGSLCAFVPSRPSIVWACPAPDATCWTTSRECSVAAKIPSNSQTLCVLEETTWCCDKEYEVCTTVPHQINVCVSRFENKFKDMSPEQANEMGVIPVSSIRESTESTRTSTIASTSSTLTTNTASSPASPSNSAVGGKSLSGGAIAGITLGSIFVLINMVAAVLLLLRYRKRSQNRGRQLPDDNYYQTHGNEICRYQIPVRPLDELPDSEVAEIQSSQVNELPENATVPELPGLYNTGHPRTPRRMA